MASDPSRGIGRTRRKEGWIHQGANGSGSLESPEGLFAASRADPGCMIVFPVPPDGKKNRRSQIPLKVCRQRMNTRDSPSSPPIFAWSVVTNLHCCRCSFRRVWTRRGRDAPLSVARMLIIDFAIFGALLQPHSDDLIRLMGGIRKHLGYYGCGGCSDALALLRFRLLGLDDRLALLQIEILPLLAAEI